MPHTKLINVAAGPPWYLTDLRNSRWIDSRRVRAAFPGGVSTGLIMSNEYPPAQLLTGAQRFWLWRGSLRARARGKAGA